MQPINTHSSCLQNTFLIGSNILFLVIAITTVVLAILKGGMIWVWGVGGILGLGLSVAVTIWKWKVLSKTSQEENDKKQQILNLLQLHTWTQRNSSVAITMAHSRLEGLFGIYGGFNFHSLPTEIIKYIFTLLIPSARVTLACSCKYFNGLISRSQPRTDYIQSYLYYIQQRYGDQPWWSERAEDIRQLVTQYLHHYQTKRSIISTNPMQLLNITQLWLDENKQVRDKIEKKGGGS